MDVSNAMVDHAVLRLSRAILLYDTNNKETLATVHPVHIPKGAKERAEILPGACLTREALESILRNLSEAPQSVQILPERALCLDSVRMAWWTPAARRPIFFNTHDKEFTKEVDGKTVAYPPLVFLARSRALRVYALTKDERPQAGTKLFRAPFMNLYEDGLMCSGDTKLPDVVQACDIPLWERAFFDTRFTHTNVNIKLSRHKDGHNSLWREMLTADTFPSKALAAVNLTLGEAVAK